MPSLYVRFRNFSHPGFSACFKCGGNWGWKKHTGHFTSSQGGLFLFCRECDPIVTPEERWKALDEWKHICIGQLHMCSLSQEQIQQEAQRIEDTEFIEFPRPKSET